MDGDGAMVTLVVPATAEYLRLARLASADAGSRAGFDYEEIDDLRIAVTELCHLLIGDGGTGRMTLEFRPLDGGLAVEGRAADPPPRNDDDHVSETILATVVDEHEVSDAADGRRFRLVKRRRA